MSVLVFVVNMETGSTICEHVSLGDSIFHLKQKIKNRHIDCPLDKIVLIHEGHPLDDKVTFKALEADPVSGELLLYMRKGD